MLNWKTCWHTVVSKAFWQALQVKSQKCKGCNGNLQLSRRRFSLRWVQGGKQLSFFSFFKVWWYCSLIVQSYWPLKAHVCYLLYWASFNLWKIVVNIELLNLIPQWIPYSCKFLPVLYPSSLHTEEWLRAFFFIALNCIAEKKHQTRKYGGSKIISICLLYKTL